MEGEKPRRSTGAATQWGGASYHRHHPYAKPAYGRSSLRDDQVSTAKDLARRLATDKSRGRIELPYEQLEAMALAVVEARADGKNPRTASKDAFALREWRAFAEVANFDPDTQSEWVRQFPERENLKLACFLLWRAQRSIPRSRKGVVITVLNKPELIIQW